MANNASNVSFGKPKATGGVWIAPAGSTLPTDGTTALDAAFVNMGYISDEGYVSNVETDTEEVTAWGGDTVLTAQSSFRETHTVNFIETNANTLKTIYGEDNVTVDGQTGAITVNSTSAELPECVVVIELLLTGSRVKRVVIPKAKIADRSAEISYSDTEAIAYPAVFSAAPDTNGNYHIEYIATVA